ncbi:MAG: hypothetical protein JW944_11255 [Deltaproteobacteria bacterium]|nr:hypothetical protein [Deltaproteobacteria bacterium]
MEHLAGNLYLILADRFLEDEEFSRFPSDLARDEKSHLQIIRTAKHRLLMEKGERSEITVDQSVKDRIETPLRDIYERVLSSQKITRNNALKIVVKVEFAEFNPIFLYTVNSLKKNENDGHRFFQKGH